LVLALLAPSLACSRTPPPPPGAIVVGMTNAVLIAADVPYVPLWYRINVAVCEPDIEGVSRSPIADFTFLKDVYRTTDS